MPYPWNHSRSDWAGFWAPWSSGRSPQDGWSRWPWKVPSSPSHSLILFDFGSMSLNLKKGEKMEKRWRKWGKHVRYCLESKSRQFWREETTANIWKFVVLYDFSLVISILVCDISGCHSKFIAELVNGAENLIPAMLILKYMTAERWKTFQWKQKSWDATVTL